MPKKALVVDHDWEWLGDHLGLDFANTVRRQGMVYVELLRTPEDLRQWARRQRGRVPVPALAEARSRLDELRSVRDDAFAVLARVAARESPPPAPARRLDELALANPMVAQLRRPGPRSLRRGSRIDELLARVVAATIELGTGDRASDLTLCDAPSCGQLFLRDRDNRVWCGPGCGSRARVARHAARRRKMSGRP